MGNFIDLTGNTFGRLTVLSRGENKGTSTMWNCICECGEKTTVYQHNLVSSQTKSCGCLNKRKKIVENLIGRRFGRLQVIDYSRKDNKNLNHWICKCDCGNIKEFYQNSLIYGGSQSCGCLLVDRLFEKGVVKKLDETRQKHLNVESGTLVHSLYRKTRRDNQTGVKGVSYEKNINKYRARITFKGKKIELGRYIKLEDAIKARKDAEEKYFRPVIEKAKVLGVIS